MMRVVLKITLIFLLISTTAIIGVEATDDAVGQQTGSGVCSSSAADDVEGACPDLLSEPTNDATVSPVKDTDDDDEDDDYEKDDVDEAEGDEELEFECIDEEEKCPAYAESGACTGNAGYMTYHCAVSCNTCQVVMDTQRAAQFVREGTNSKPCMDDHYNCLEWAGMGECDNNPG